jgi:hypothetical protein
MSKPRKYTSIPAILRPLYAAKLEGMTNPTLGHPERIPQAREESKNPAALATGIATEFDSLTSRLLSLWPAGPCRGFPCRSILDFARNDRPVRSSFEFRTSFVICS